MPGLARMDGKIRRPDAMKNAPCVKQDGAAEGADCHAGDIGHWLAMTGFAWSATGGGTHGSRPTAVIFVGQGPCALPEGFRG